MVKILISGKGGSGKSTIVTLLAKKLKEQGKKVILIDSDESNLCLNNLVGIEKPKETLLEYLGGKGKILPQMMENALKGIEGVELFDDITIDDLEDEYVSWDGNFGFIEVGKIEETLEGCACSMGTILQNFLEHLQLKDDEWVLCDMEAGIEHFGRGVITGADYVIAIIDPSNDGILLANKAYEMTNGLGKKFGAVFNKVDENSSKLIESKIDSEIKILGKIPNSIEIMSDNIEGKPVDLSKIEGIEEIIENIN